MSNLKRVYAFLISGKSKTLVILLILGAIIFYQGVMLFNNTRSSMIQVYHNIGQPALWRGAQFSHSKKFAQYIRFLNDVIPEDALVVLPPPGYGPKVIHTTPSMQFFLAPREIINCNDLSCLKNINGDKTYILVVDEFPRKELMSLNVNYLMFDKGWGIVLPEEVRIESRPKFRGYNNLVEIFQAGLWPFVWLMMLTFVGFLITHYLFIGIEKLLKIAVGYGIGLGIFSITIGAVSLAGISINQITVKWVTGALLIISLFIGLLDIRHRNISRNIKRSAQQTKWFFDFWLLFFLLLGVISLVISVGKGYHTSDEIVLWGAKGYGIAAMESVRNILKWGTNTVPYPLHIPILIASEHILFAETLPASKMIFSGYYVALLLVIYHYLQERGVQRILSAFFVLMVGTIPIIFRHSTIAYANLPMSFYFVCAVILLINSLEQPEKKLLQRSAFLSAMFFTAAAWTRPEGLIMAWFGIGLIMAVIYFRNRIILSCRFIIILITPLSVYSLFWILLKTSIYPPLPNQTDIVAEVISQILSGNLHLREGLFVLESTYKLILNFETWGALGFVVILTLISIPLSPRINQSDLLLLLIGLLFIGMMIGIYYITSFDRVHDISWWISTGYDRMLLPGILLLLIGGFSLISKFFSYHRSDPTSIDPK